MSSAAKHIAPQVFRPAVVTDELAEIYILDYLTSYDYGGITDRAIIEQLQAYRGRRLRVVINSPGGDYWTAISIKSALEQHEGTVDIRINGVAASGASIIALAGDTIEIAEGAAMLIHNAVVSYASNVSVDTAMEMAASLEQVNAEMVRIYANRTKLSEEEIRALMAENRMMYSEEAVAKGFADKIYKRLPIAAFANPYHNSQPEQVPTPNNQFQHNQPMPIESALLAKYGLPADATPEQMEQAIQQQAEQRAAYQAAKRQAEAEQLLATNDSDRQEQLAILEARPEAGLKMLRAAAQFKAQPQADRGTLENWVMQGAKSPQPPVASIADYAKIHGQEALQKMRRDQPDQFQALFEASKAGAPLKPGSTSTTS